MSPRDYLSLPLETKRAIVSALGARRVGEFQAAPSPPPAASAPPARAPSPAAKARGARPIDFSLLFFSNDASKGDDDKYLLLRECAKFADENGFKAVWVPERHFHPFGGLYPNPAILCAALASVTRNIRLRAGSVVLPLQDPIRVAEAWAMVDNLSGGRVDISFASGWNPNDFVLSPDTYPRIKEVLVERVEQVRRLWRGESLRLPNGKGELVDTRIYPRPIQPELPVWWTAVGNPATFRQAGLLGCNLLTMLYSTSIEELGKKLALYRQARVEAGQADAEGIVTLMLHTFVHKDMEHVQRKVREPFLAYIRSSLDVQRHGMSERPQEAEMDRMAEFAYQRYFRTGALFGPPAACLDLLGKAADAGVQEVACQLDFGVDTASVLESLADLKDLRERHERSVQAARISHPGLPDASAAERLLEDGVAVVGMSGRFPRSADLDAFWGNLARGADMITQPPPDRWPGREIPSEAAHGGFIDDVDAFDAAFFGLSEAEAASMDPHQRLFLETAWSALEDAGYPPGTFGAARVGLFVGMYSLDYNQLLGSDVSPGNAPRLTGRLNVMVANRVSHLLDLRGPSELVDTACSSSLVAIHRAVQALAAGDCDMALAGGISLLLSPQSSEWLGHAELLSKTGKFRPFDRRSDGLVRGEGTGAVVLKPLGRAVADGDTIHAVLRASGVNHNGRDGGALITPNAKAQADLIVGAYRKARVGADTINYIEAHGAASELGDFVEISAFGRAFSKLAPSLGRRACGIGSVKANIGALDAAGGIAGVIKVVLALRHREWPATINYLEPRSDLEWDSGPFYVVERTEAWREPANPAHPRRAAVHAYGLGGVNAHVVLEEHPRSGDAGAPSGAGGEAGLLFPFSARDSVGLRETLERFRDWLGSGGGPIPDAAYTLRVGRVALPERLAIVALGREDLASKLSAHLEGLPCEGVFPGRGAAEGGRGAAQTLPVDLPGIARAWADGGDFPSEGAALPARGRRISLPTYPFRRQRFRTPAPARGGMPLRHPLLDSFGPRVGGASFKKRFSRFDPVVAEHRYLGTPLVPAAAWCEMARAAAQSLHLGAIRRIESVVFMRPLPVASPDVTVTLELRVGADIGDFEASSGAAGARSVHCSGRFVWDPLGTPPAAERLDLAAATARCPRQLGEEALYREFGRLEIDYGASFRNLKQVHFSESEALGRFSTSSTLWGEYADGGLQPGVMDCLLQLGVVFGPEGRAAAQLPLSIEGLELAGALPSDGWAYLQRIEADGPAGVCRFHGAITDATGRVFLKVRDLCLKGPPAGAVHGSESGPSTSAIPQAARPDAASVLSDLAAGRITVEAADDLLSGPATGRVAAAAPAGAVHSLAAELSRRMPAAELRFVVRLGAEASAEEWNVVLCAGSFAVAAGPGDAGEAKIIVAGGDLQRLMDGNVDPIALILRGGLSVQPDSALSLRQKICALWFEKFNRRHLPARFRDHLLGRIYGTGEVTSGPEVRREIFPWALSAEAGAVLFNLVLGNRLDRTLEIGMAYGLSSLFLCQAHQDKAEGGHVAIDPCQKAEFLSIGLGNIRAAGLEARLRFMDEPDYLALPALLREGRGYGLVFIDGLHMFDYTMLDFFYADRLLDEQGFLVFDDGLLPGVARAIEYVRSNRAYEPIDLGCERLAGFRKRAADARSMEDPNFHRDF